ncbi:hypothetical protein J7K86_02370, partial [bacterium]|nr:hypothetical protein [bacterium]
VLIFTTLFYIFLIFLFNNLFFSLKLVPVQFSLNKKYFINSFWQVILNTSYFLIIFNIFRKKIHE